MMCGVSKQSAFAVSISPAERKEITFADGRRPDVVTTTRSFQMCASSPSRSSLISLFSTFLQMTLAFQVLVPLTSVRSQEKTPDDTAVYTAGHSAEDRLKSAEKRPIPTTITSSASLAPPANDNFASASGFISPQGSGFTLATNVDATRETGEPIHGAGNGGVGGAQNSVWYAFTPSATSVITIFTSSGTENPIGDTVLSAYVGSAVNSLTPIAENDDYPGLGFYSKITVGVTAGQTYHLAVDGYSNAVGTFFVNYAYSPQPGNDNFASAETFTTSSSPFIGITGSTINATGEPGEPNHTGNSGSLNSIWYSWRAPASASMTFSTAGSTFDTTLAVYIGSSVGSLTLVANDDDDGPGNSSRVTIAAIGNITYHIAIEGFASETGNTLLNWDINRAESSKQFDLDGDLKTDFSVFRSTNNVWYTLRSSDLGFDFIHWGLPLDVRVPGIDYEGDDVADIAIWRPSTGVFYVRRSSDGFLLATQWGVSGDLPVQGDFDGDDRSDFAVWRPSTGIFYILQSQTQTLFAYQWGLSSDRLAPGDYDGDGRTDIAIWRPSTGTFYIARSLTGISIIRWGLNGDTVVPGDYDGDGKNDLAVYRNSNHVFYARRSSDAGLFALQWGIDGDILAPGDYDGNGISDVCVWRPFNGNFYVNRTGTSQATVVHWGQNGDLPIANSNVH